MAAHTVTSLLGLSFSLVAGVACLIWKARLTLRRMLAVLLRISLRYANDDLLSVAISLTPPAESASASTIMLASRHAPPLRPMAMGV